MAKAQGCFYCEEHHEGREAIMYRVGELSGSTVYLFRDQSHLGRCVVACADHKKELFELSDEERNNFMADVARVGGAVKKLWGCTKINLGSFGDTNPHLHFHIVPKYEGGLDFGGSFVITRQEPTVLAPEKYEEMIAQLKAELGI